MVRLLPFVLLLAGCGVAVPGNPLAPSPAPVARPLPPGTWIEDRSEPKIIEERLVADWILKHAQRPKTVRFLRWGPHDLDSRWIRKAYGGYPGTQAIRVRTDEKDYAGKVHPQDHVYLLHEGNVTVGLSGTRDWNDRWFGDLPADD